MKISHQEYLERQLNSKKLELEQEHIKYRIMIAEYNVKKELIGGLIDSIEAQLHDRAEEVK